MLEAERQEANLKGLLPLIYIIPSYLAHLIVLITIFSKKNQDELGTNFYKIYSVSSVTAVLSSICLFIYNRVRYTPCLMFIFNALPPHAVYLTFIYSCTYYFIYVELFTNLVLNINRASIIFLKSRYQNFWKVALIPMLAFFFVISILFIIHHWFTNVTLKPIDPNDLDKGYDWSKRVPTPPWLKDSLFMLVIAIFVAVGSLISNIYVITYLVFSGSNRQSFSEKGNYEAQKRLFIFTMLSFLIRVAFAIQQVMFTVVDDLPTIYFLLGIQAYIGDLVNLSPPWLLLFVSPQVRKCVLQTFGLKAFTSVVHVSPASKSNLSHVVKSTTVKTTTNNC